MRYHWCVRVYNDDSRAVEIRDETQLPEWLEYNKVFRFGNALFVDGVCQNKGYLSVERCDAWSVKLTEEFATKTQEQLARNKAKVGRDGYLVG